MMKTAYFAGGCFWCITPFFKMTDGVLAVESGYSGGDEPNPSYADVKSQRTGHRETIRIDYDETLVSFATLFDMFLGGVDPFDGGGQFIDRGHSYTLAVYYLDEEQKRVAEEGIARLEASSGERVYVAVEPFKSFYPAEEEHQDYYLKHPEELERELIESGRKKTTLRLMSNNIWWRDDNAPAWEEIGADCSAPVRAAGFARVYRETQPDVIGLQECSAAMAWELMSRLTEGGANYAMLWGRDTPILYRADRFELIDSEFAVYPEDVPGLDGSFNNAMTKSYCIAVLRVKGSGELLIFATTHLWWKSSDPSDKNYQAGSDEARAWQINLLLDRLDELRSRYGCPAVVVGDFNARYGSPAVQSALGRGWTHAYDDAAEHRDETRGHHFCFAEGYDMNEDAGCFDEAIDQILVRGAGAGFVRRFERYEPDWYMPLSDHFPVWADIEFCHKKS